MGNTVMMILTLVLATTTIITAQRGDTRPAESPEVALKAAMNIEFISGDVAGAIARYRALADRYRTTASPVAAKALVQMAASYERLGKPEARETYEEILRVFPEQRDAVALARKRLAEGAAVVLAARGDRAVWTGLDVDLFGTVSPDGRYLTYTDWNSTNNLMVRDLKNGSSRPLTNNSTYGEFGYTGYSAISRDGRYVAYEWNPRDTNRQELRVTELAAATAPSARVVRSEERRKIRPFDWSPDGKWVAALITEDTSNQIGLIAVSDGELRILKSIDWRGPMKILFSPDGRYIAFDLAGWRHARAPQIVMAADGSRETAVVSDPGSNTLMGWSRDGDVLFTSDRSGTLALWSVPIAEGKPQSKGVLFS